jgi:outer membrane protein assembly factor BamB
MQRVTTIVVFLVSVILVIVLFQLGTQSVEISKEAKSAPVVVVKTAAYKVIESTRDSTHQVAHHKTIQRDAYDDEIFAMNEDANLTFSSSFSPGVVSPGKAEKYHTKIDSGYAIHLADNTSVVTPAIYENKLYVSGGFGSKSYYCFNANDGGLVWAVNLSDDGPSSAVFGDSTVVFNTESCTIFALNSRTGKMLWSAWLGDPLMTTPTVANGKVFTSYPALTLMSQSKSNYKHAKPSHAFACFNLHTGKVLWQKWLDADVMTSPVAYGNSVYLTTFAGTVYKMSQKTGKIEAAAHIRATSIPSIYNGKIYITKRADKKDKVCESIAVLDADDLTKLNEFHVVEAPYLDQNVQNTSVLKDKAMAMDAGNGFVSGAPEISGYKLAQENIGYSNVSSLQSFQGSSLFVRNGHLFNCMGNTIYCLDPRTGKEEWQYRIEGAMEKEGGYLCTAPIAAGDYLVTVTLSGKVKVLDLESGKVVKELDVKSPVRTQPIVDKGRIYVSTALGSLVCFNTGNEQIDGWPMLMMNSQHAVN